jgi:SAM-dependent methyltransferase
LELLSGSLADGNSVLDAGCGTGTFISELSVEHSKVSFVGVDPSMVSIKTAEKRRRPGTNCVFRTASVEDLLSVRGEPVYFDAVIANMLLQTVGNLTAVLKSCSSLLKPAGVFVFAVSHPCFWPRYWGYDEEPWFRYDNEIWIEAPFRTSLSPRSQLRATHIHRPLESYVNNLSDVGLVLDKLTAPMPDDDVEGAYPIAWEFPRFLIGRARRLG